MSRGTREHLARLTRRSRAVKAAHRLAPENGDARTLVANLAEHRGRPIALLPMPLPPEAPSGMWVATEVCDYLIYPSDTSLTRATAVICHEVGHIILDHNPGLTGDETGSLLNTLAPDLAPDKAARVLARHGYASEQESDAEYLATVLVTLLARSRDCAEWSRPGSMSARLR